MGSELRFLCVPDCHDQFGPGRTLRSRLSTDEIRKKLVIEAPVRGFVSVKDEGADVCSLKVWGAVSYLISKNNSF